MKDYHTLPDLDLVTLFRNGDQASEEELYRRYHPGVFRYCMALMSDHDAADDAAQDTFVAANQSIHNLRSDRSFRSWLFRIARNVCLMNSRSNSRHLRLDEPDNVEDDGTPLDLVLSNEFNAALSQALALLRPVYREAFVLREYDALTYNEIAEATGASPATVKFRIHKARQTLVQLMGKLLDERIAS